MSYFVSLTFDLQGAKTSDYSKVRDELENLDFSKFIIGRKKVQRTLPSNTFIAEFDNEDFEKLSEVTEWVNIEFKKIAKKLGLSGSFFVTVGRNWAWKTNTF